MRTVLLALSLLLLADAAWAQTVQRCPAQLPAPVAAKRDAIIAAAKARDLPALKRLIRPGEFTFSFGDDGADPTAYWRDSIKQGIDVPHYMAAIFAMRCGVMVDSGVFLFPISAAMDWKHLTPAEKKEMEALYGKDIDQWFVEGRDKGYSVGWRGVIEKNGAWSAFVAGD